MNIKDYSQMIGFLTRDKTSTVPRPMDQEPRTMAQGGRTGFEDGMRVMEDKLISNYKTKLLKELDAGKKPSEIQSFEDYKKTQTEVDMNPGKKKLDKTLTDAKKLIKSPKFKSQVVPGLESLMKAADSIKGDFAKKKFLTAGFKTLGVAVGAPLIAYDTYQAYKKGKPMLEALEEGFIGTSIIGDTKKVFALNPEEREARSIVKQDQMNKKVAQDFSMLDTDFMQPIVQSDLNVDQATKNYEIAKQRVLDLETQKNANRAKNRQFSGIESLEIDL